MILFQASEISELDPPEHLFRIRLVCTLLDSCGQYFDRGTSKKRLDCFLIYFQVKKNNKRYMFNQ
jgi:regulator of nonsense transcripts 2